MPDEEETIEEVEEIKLKTQQASFVWTPEIIEDFEKFLIDLLRENLACEFSDS